LIVAHRTCPTHAPENTLAGVRAARDLGADVVEVDVRLSSDGVPVVIHDWHLLWIARRARLVSSLPLAELERVHVLGSDETIPTLASVLEELGPMGIAIDIRDRRAATPVLNVVNESSHRGIVLGWSEYEQAVRELAAAGQSDVEVALLRGSRRPKEVAGMLRDAVAMGAKAVSADERIVDRAFVEDAGAHGLGVYTMVNAKSAEAIAEKAGLGLLGVVTDWPELARRPG
jgi:glycerophosphoryl diester phosphodiesterase